MHTLLHIYGPFSIHSYGLAIAIALIVFSYLIRKDPRFHQLKLDPIFSQILLVGAITAALGGKILFFIEQPHLFESPIDLLTFWQPGFSILGAILAVILVMPWYLYKHAIAPLAFFDLMAIYTPLLQSISRLGCFFAGCCFGAPTTSTWAIIYRDPESAAPRGVCLHPTQIYSALLLLLIFAAMYFVFKHIFKKPGQLVCLYLMLSSSERFIVDFWRGDRTVLAYSPYALSFYQIIAVGIIVSASTVFIGTLIRRSSS